MRLYSVAEARALLPALLPVLADIREAYVRLRALQAAVGAEARAASADGHLLVDPYEATAAPGESERLESRIRAGLETLASHGVELKDPVRGLIDFYHVRAGETVCLCFHLGEDDIGYWHTLADGFAGRRPI